MIATTHLLQYPLVAIAPGMQEKLNSISRNLKIKPTIIAYLNSYFHIIGIYLDEKVFSSLEEIEEAVDGLEGYLLSNTKFTKVFVAQILNKAVLVLAAMLGIKWTRSDRKTIQTLEMRQQNSLRYYESIQKSEHLLKYYSGWWFQCREGKTKFVNLIGPYLCYGEKLTYHILDLIECDFSRFSHHSCITRQVHLKRILSLMCKLYPNREKLSLLQDGKNVNEFVEILFANQRSNITSKGLDVKTFYKGWPTTIAVFNELLTETAIMSAPEWNLLCPTYKSASECNVKEEQMIFDKAFIDVPLNFSDEKAFNAFKSALDEELSFIEESCMYAFKKEIDSHLETAEKSRLGKVITNFLGLQLGVDFTECDVCRTWQEFTYSIAKTGIFKVIPARKFLQIVKPLRAHTLLPALHLLVQHHPIITPSWLTEFELFDSSGQQVNYTQSGDNWIATGFKPRAKGQEQQSIVLTNTTKCIFDEIIKITKDARDYLRSIGDDSYRRLLLSGGRGLQTPSHIDIITPVGKMNSDIPLRNTMLGKISRTFPRERVERIVARLSPRTLRDAVAIQIYLQTMSMEAVAVALGHATGETNTGERYIPSMLRYYMMERWLRLFQNAIVYEAMRDSPYMLDAMDFSTLQELDDFLLAHKEHYKIIPDKEMAVYQPYDKLENSINERLYIELNLAKLEILLCLYEIICAALKTGIEVVEAAMRWYPIATLIYQAVHLHKEGNLSGYCSRSVLVLFSKANPSRQLLENLKGVVHA
ncbi:hypothetical protein [Pseudomonas fragi]|uniref:hypothetical protein n=1 Tax=Pseudomonas fragi TaxID=296 RepID=UPI001474242C|nr:hypothetical protein [Pseudomonas fragi]NNB55727.1 hypothetical protein [Pseudomonas fragi]